jgi:hypothetical protein
MRGEELDEVLQVFPEFMAIVFLPLKVQRAQRDSRT